MKARRAQQPVAVASPLHDASLLRASLALPLQAADDNLPDFMFTLKLQDEADPPAVWHPCPLTAQNLPSGALSRTLSALAYGSLADLDVSAHLKHAFAGKAGLHNLQVDWVEHDGSPRCWLVSTCRQQPSSGNGTSIVLGVVREVTPARQLADDIAGGLLVTRETRARTRLIGASVAASMRQQAHLISSLCDLLAGTPQADANNAGHRYGELTSDVRGAVKELLACAGTLRDYTDA